MIASDPVRILLINPNRGKPIVAPICFDYLMNAVERDRILAEVLDFGLLDHPFPTVCSQILGSMPDLIGITIRNLDDAIYGSSEFYLDEVKSLIDFIKTISSSPIVLGGSGFSIAPDLCLEYTNADIGIFGEGELAFGCVIDALTSKKEIVNIPGLVFRSMGKTIVNQPNLVPLAEFEVRRNFVDNSLYYTQGGLGNIQTKRGCPENCIYCVEPQIAGKTYRFRSMRSITSELKGLVRNGISDIYVCDSEFNMPLRHSRQVCSALIREGLGDKLRWHAFINPVPFDVEVAELMKRSGCASLSITADSGDDTILRKYGKNFSGDDLKCVARICHRLNLDFRCTLLLGGPGETRETIRRTIDLMKELEPDHVEVITGMRVYPNTPLASFVRRQGMSSYPNLHGNCSRNQDFLKPIFYISSAVGPEIQEITQEMIGNDPRFTLGSTDMISSGVGRMMSEVLPAINQGYRGPAWHFLSNHLNRISP